MHTTLLADGWHGGGPGPWILLVPLFWIGVAVFLRKVVFRGRGRRPEQWPGRGPWAAAGFARQAPAPSPIDTLNRRYAEGLIDEFEYRERYDLLSTVVAAPAPTPGAAPDAPAAPTEQ